MATRYENFLPKLQVQLLDCPDPVAIDALRAACIDFCTKTQWWLFEPEPITISEGVAVYPIDTPTGTVPAAVVAAWADTVQLSPIDAAALAARDGNWRETRASPVHYLQIAPDEITLYPQPDTRIAQGLKLMVALRPSQDSVEVDSSVYEWWYPSIVAGALAQLYTHAGRPYANPAAAPLQAAIFTRDIGVATAQRQRSLTNGPLHVQMRRWV